MNFLLKKNEENFVNMPRIQLKFRRFHKQRLLMITILVTLFASGTLKGVLLPQTPAYAETGSGTVNTSTSTVVEKSGEGAFAFMQQQLSGYREKLGESERRLQDFQQKHGIILLETQMGHLLQQRKSLDDSLMGAENKVKGFQEKFAWVQGQISQIPDEVPLSSSAQEQGLLGGAKKHILDLQIKEQELLNKYHENNPHIQSLRREIELINQFIKEQKVFSTGKNPLYAEMEMQLFHTQADLVSAKAQSGVILQQIAEVDTELDRLRNLRPELDALQRQVTADEKNYINYLAKVGTTPPQDYRIQVEDQLDIKFFFNPELNETVLVRPDGRIALQLIGEISVVGHSVEEIRTVLIKRYSGQLKNPEVAVLLRSSTVSADDNSATGGEGSPGGGNGN